MVNYSTARELTIENVELPINILGVPHQAIIGCFWSFLVILAMNPLLAPLGSIGFGIIARIFFLKEQEGRPLVLEKKLLNFIEYVPIFKNYIPGLDGIIFSQGDYYGS